MSIVCLDVEHPRTIDSSILAIVEGILTNLPGSCKQGLLDGYAHQFEHRVGSPLTTTVGLDVDGKQGQPFPIIGLR
jgi:hypothetical protein